MRSKSLFVAIAFIILTSLATAAQAQERLCDTAFEDCRAPLWSLIDNETVGIDVAYWFMQDTSIANKIVARWQAGVPVRILVDPRANPTYAGNEQILNQFKAAGIPMRYKNAGGILHWKMMLFVGQNRLEFTGANYGASFFVPTTPNSNYIDEAIYFTDDQSLINSFKTRYDDLWTDTFNYSDYGNINGPLTRKYPIFPIDPDLNIPPSLDDSQDFYLRTAQNMNAEAQKIDIIMYRITNQRYTDTTIAAVNRGIPVRLIHEPDEYRNPARQWDSWNIDRMFMAGVQIKMRKHLGLNHQKSVILYGKGMTIFSSSNWTGPSSNSQQEHNYFTTKPWFTQWFIDQFERKWNSATENEPFVPKGPEEPANQLPVNNATGQSTTLTLKWEGGRWAHKYDIYFGTSPTPPLLIQDASTDQSGALPNQPHLDTGSVDDGVPETFTLPMTLNPGTTYFWRIVGKTMANLSASGPTWTFTTSGSAPGPTPTPSPTPTPTPGQESPNNTRIPPATQITDSVGAVWTRQANGTILRNGASTSGAGSQVLYCNHFVYAFGTDSQWYRWNNGWSGVGPIDPCGGGGTPTPTPTPSPTPTVTPTPFPPTPTPTPTPGGESPNNTRVPPASEIIDSFGAHWTRLANGTILRNGSSAAGGAGSVILYCNHIVYVLGTDNQWWRWNNGWSPAGPVDPCSGGPTPTPTPTPTPLPESPNNTRVPPGTQIVDSAGAIWTRAGNGVILRNGTSSGGAGSVILYCNHVIYVLGTDNQWWRWSNGWSPVGVVDPCGGPSSIAPTITTVSPSSGPVDGGTSITISGSGFASGATLTLGGASASSVSVINDTTIIALTSASTAGTVDVVVTNTDATTATKTDGFTYYVPQTTVPLFDHVFIVAAENQSFESVIGSASMPYLNALADRYGLAVNFYANNHPSIGNYFWLTTGQNITNDSNFSGTVDVDNIVRQINSAGKTWRAYAESIPSTGYLGGDSYPYVKRHNPFAYFTDVINSPSQANNIVPFSQFASHLANNQLPNYAFIIPNQQNNAHDCPAAIPSCTNADKLAATDNWLKTNIDPLLASPAFRQNGLLVITFDESVNSDTVNGGGHIATVVISPKANQNYESTTLLQHPSTLRLTAEGLGLAAYPGAAATANNMSEFFSAAPNTAPIVGGVSPGNGPAVGGTSVTISGTGFASGATVSFGGAAATNVQVVGSTTITATTPAHSSGAVNVVVQNPGGESGTLTNGYTYASSGETVLLADDFNDSAIDGSKWIANNLFSGFTDASVPLLETTQFNIGPLKSGTGGSHYNGIKSATGFNFTGSYAYVQLVQGPDPTTAADGFFTIGLNVDNCYRMYVESGDLIVQSKIFGAKQTLLTVAYNSTNHAFWRMRHDAASGQIVFEAAPANGNAPGTWVQLAATSWNTAAVPLTGVSFELKGGTWRSEANPGTVVFDNFKAAKP